MKNKIAFRLVSYFAVSFIVFAIIIGVLFSALFSRHNTEIHKAELERRAVSIADTVSEMLNGNMGRGIGMTGGLGAYLRFIEDIAMADVWIIDRDLELITFGRGHMRHRGITPRDLPDGAEQTVLDAFDGQASVSGGFSDFLETPTITVATPIITNSGNVIGVVLLHSHVSNINAVTNSGVLILVISIMIAILISVFIAVALSLRFTKPLAKMKKAALLISGGDYSSKTDVKQADEIGELAAVLDNMADRLALSAQESAKLDKLRRDFVANISHELRTPVTVIRGSLEAICDGVVTDAAKITEYNRQMLSESIYLERLVSDLLDLARLQNPDFAIERNDIELKEIVDDVTRSMNRIAEQKDVTLDLISEGKNFTITGDYGRLRQMLVIVLDNAIKFSREKQSIYITIARAETEITLSIRDEGCGISPEDIPHIFERFYKQRSEQNKMGTGLGLAIAKQIADRHNVAVKVASSQDEGTEFLFIFSHSVTI